MGGHIDVFTEEAGFGRGTQEPYVRAAVVTAGAAILAVIAVNGGFQHGAIAFRQAGNPCSDLMDFACRLVTENNRERIFDRADAAVLKVM
jgi:hypothetical protein